MKPVTQKLAQSGRGGGGGGGRLYEGAMMRSEINPRLCICKFLVLNFFNTPENNKKEIKRKN